MTTVHTIPLISIYIPLRMAIISSFVLATGVYRSSKLSGTPKPKPEAIHDWPTIIWIKECTGIVF
jgi:hypothetical protein